MSKSHLIIQPENCQGCQIEAAWQRQIILSKESQSPMPCILSAGPIEMDHNSQSHGFRVQSHRLQTSVGPVLDPGSGHRPIVPNQSTLNYVKPNSYGKLHFTTLYYILHPKLLKCTFCILNYDSCYSLHHEVKFVINLNGNIMFMMQSIIKSILSPAYS